VLRARENVPPEAWDSGDWSKSRVGRYDLVRFDRAQIERWLASPETDRQSTVPEPQGNEAQAAMSGTRTNRAAAAEQMCRQWIAELKERPIKDAAFVQAQAAVKEIGRLSRKAFERAWANSAPANWKRGGRRKKSPPPEI
jgi:hypothetical protein